MNRHQCHLVIRVSLIAVEICKQSHLLKEVGQIHLLSHILLTTALHKVLHTTEKLLQVLLS